MGSPADLIWVIITANWFSVEIRNAAGKRTYYYILVTLNLLAFAFHAAAYLTDLVWRAAVIARGPTYRFFEHPRTVTVYVDFQDWPDLLRSIAAAAIRPP
jgi:hypothetical protein